MVQFLQATDAVRGDPGEHVLPQHEAPQRPLQPRECQGGDGVQFVMADLQTPGSCTEKRVRIDIEINCCFAASNTLPRHPK